MEGYDKFRIAKLGEARGLFQKALFREIGLDAQATDLAKEIGIKKYKNSFGSEYGFWMTSTLKTSSRGGEYETVHDVIALGAVEGNKFDPTNRFLGCRPMIESHVLRAKAKKIGEKEIGIDVFEYGEYPQDEVEDEIAQKLSDLKMKNILEKTGKSYQFNVNFERYSDLEYKDYDEYIYNEKKYIYKTDEKNSNGVWIEVKPIEWYADTRVAISKNILFSGVCVLDVDDYLDKYFSKNVVPSKYVEKTKEDLVIQEIQKNIGSFTENKKKLTKTEKMQEEVKNDIAKKLLEMDKKSDVVVEEPIKIKTETSEKKEYNSYGFNLDNVTEEEIIKGALQSDMPVFLHGRSSEGKSARVKQYDPDCEIIYLRNATPDSLNGKSVYNSETGEMINIPPTWYKNLCKKCEAEPDKIHIVFFDEITNSLPSIQGMAFNIVLDKEVNGNWKLPDNARIVAAGNEIKDSLAANEMAEPLFNRFAHVYIETTVNEWLDWAVTADEEYDILEHNDDVLPSKIHPAIYSYINYKSISNDDVLRTPYNGKTPNADPRKWEMASKVLYKTNQPHMLRALIGEDLTTDFIAFCSQQVLSVEDVINHTYDEDVFNMNLSEKYATVIGLASVSEDDVEIVREFVMKLGPEICAVFDNVWARNNERRLEKIAELKMMEEEMSR